MSEGEILAFVEGLLVDAAKAAWERSWYNAPQLERRFRMKLVRELSAELAEIEAKSIQGTAFGEHVIEAIILGDYREVAHLADIIRLMAKDPHERHPERWACFLAMVDAGLAIKRGEQPA